MGEVLFPVRDIMVRTRENLAYIDQAYQRGERVWEVTQLINSFMGALAHPWELMSSELDNLKFSDPEGASWPCLGYQDDADEKPNTIGHQLRLVRNAFAHGNIRFLNDTRGQIASIQMWNVKDRYRTWSVEVELDTLQELLDKFIEVSMQPLTRIDRRMPEHIKTRSRETSGRCQKCGIDLRAPQLRDQALRVRRQQRC